MFDRLRLLFAKGLHGVCRGVEEIGIGFQQWCVVGWQARKEDRVRSVASGRAILGDQESLPYTSTVLEFVDGGSVNVLRMRDLAEAKKMGLGGSLLVKAAALATVSASSLPGIPLCPGIHRRLIGPGRAFKGDLR